MNNDSAVGDLNEIQQQMMLEFQDFTGIEDTAVCRDMLNRHQWNLEIAIQEQLNINEGRPTLFASSADESRAPEVINDQYMQTVFASVGGAAGAHYASHNSSSSSGIGTNSSIGSSSHNHSNSGGQPATASHNASASADGSGASGTVAAAGGGGRPGGLTGLIGYVVHYIFGWCYSTMSSIVQSLFGLFAADERRIVTDPLGDVLQSIQQYADRYGAQHPVFYQGTYAQALNDAKRELKFLAVFLYGSGRGSRRTADAAEVDAFCRHTLSDATVCDYVSRNMLFWACDVATPEGYRVSHSMAARAYPLIVIVGLRSNKMMVMGRLEGGCGADELLRRMRQVVDENEVWLSAARADRLERSLTQTLRLQQDEAYEVSLRADQEKERVRQEELERQRLEQQALDDAVQAEIDRKAEIARLKIDLATSVPDEPAVGTPGAIIVLFKLPGGQRVERRFLSSDSLKDVYNFIFCHPTSPDYFELTTNFPKRVLQTRDSSAEQTLQQAGVQNREVLFVNDLEA